MISKAKLERDSQRADRIVVRLPAPGMRISDADELRVSDMQEVPMSDLGSPNAIQDLSVARDGDRLHSTLLLKRCAVIQEGVEYVATRALTGRVHHGIEASIGWKLFIEMEGAGRDSFP